MSMRIIGRDTEIARLRSWYKSGKAEFVALYGRRRVGKTYLINSFFDNQYDFDATGIIDGTRLEELSAFHSALKEYGYVGLKPKNWMEAFEALKEILEEKKEKGKRLVVFIDELPCLATPKSDLVKALDYFWNKWGSRQKELMLIVCGSATSWIVRNIIDNKGGLHNRITHEMHLFPFHLKETREYLLANKFKWNNPTILQAYMILGGIPYYLSLLDSSMSLTDNIDTLFFGEEAQLRGEYERLYKSLFKTPERYKAIIRLLSINKKGLTRKEIAEKLKVPNNGHLSDMLEDLVNCDFIRHYNVLGKSVRSSGGLYQLIDFYSLFYASFVKSKNNDAHFWQHTLNTPTQNNWYGLTYEKVAMAHIPQILRAIGMDRILTEYYSWRSQTSDPGAQIDLIIDRADGFLNLCEVKYSKNDYVLTKVEADKINNRIGVFREETGTNKNILVTLITVKTVKENAWSDIVDSQVSLQDLLG